MNTIRLNYLLVFVALVTGGCTSTDVAVIQDSKITEDWIIEVKQTIANPLNFKYTLLINEDEVLEILSNSKKEKKVNYQGREIHMEVDYQSKFLHTNWIVTVFVDGIPTYEKIFKYISYL